MSPAWLQGVADCSATTPGPYSPLRALVAWCTKTSDQLRMHALVTCENDHEGGRLVGRALRAGGWNGAGWQSLARLFDGDRLRLARALVRAVDGGPDYEATETR